MSMMTIAIIWIVAFVPESPKYLLERQDFTGLSQSLQQISKMNGVPDYKFKVDKIVQKLIEMQIQEAKI